MSILVFVLYGSQYIIRLFVNFTRTYNSQFFLNIFFAGMTGFGWNHEWDMSNILLGAAAHWSSSGVKWILALDEHCGPTLPKVSFTNGRPLVAIPTWANSEEDILYNQDYYSVKHMSKFLVPQGASGLANSTTGSSGSVRSAGASASSSTSAGTSASSTVRVGTSVRPVNGGDASSLILESFYNADTNTVTVIAMNKDHNNALPVQVTQGENVFFSDTLPPFSTKVYQWIKK